MKTETLTLEAAKSLRPGTILYHAHNRNADGTAQRWKVNGAPKVWKRSPERVEVPLKHGLYAYGRVTQDDLCLLCLTDPTRPA